MSLDFALYASRKIKCECGREHEIATTPIWETNVTHNLNKMAEAVGIYEILWKPEENGIIRAKEIIEPLADGIALLKSDAKKYKRFESPNGWGTYDSFIPWLEKVLDNCKLYPDSFIVVSR
jgi:hypothetical protein